MQRRLRSSYRLPRRGVGNVSKVVLTSLIMLLAVMVFARAGTSVHGCADLGALNGTATHAIEINYAGQVMGQAGTDVDSYRGVYWDPDSGGLIDIGVLPGYGYTYANDMNSDGQIAATSIGTGEGRAFVWDPNLASPVTVLEDGLGGNTWAVGIADVTDYVVGGHYVSGSAHACLWWGPGYGTFMDLGTLGGAESFAKGITGTLEVFGESDTGLDYGGIRHACYRSYVHHAQFVDIGALLPNPSTMSSCADHMGGSVIIGSCYIGTDWVGSFYYDGVDMLYLPNIDIADVNEYGEITGKDYTVAGQGRPFVWLDPSDPVNYPISYLDCGPNGGALSASPNDINDMSQVVGYADYTGGSRRACLWEPLWDETYSYECVDLGGLQGATNLVSVALSISEGGQIVGFSNCADAYIHATLWRETSPPVAVFTQEIREVAADGLTVAFDASASSDSDGAIVSYSWDFGDGTSGTGMTVVHDYASPNVAYVVVLTVTDDFGATATASRTVGAAEAAEQEIGELIDDIDATGASPETKKKLKEKVLIAAQLIEARKVHGTQDIEARKVHGDEGAANILQVFDTMVGKYTVVAELTGVEGWDLTCQANLITALLTYQVMIDGVPNYIWHCGCGPTTVGMMVGYWDSMRFNDLIGFDTSVQNADVDSMIASEGHILDYALYPDGLPERDDSKDANPAIDASKIGTPIHSDDCIADFMHTSWCAAGCRYGQTRNDMVAQGFMEYIDYISPSMTRPDGVIVDKYVGTASEVTASYLTWSYLKDEVAAKHPMAFIVDINGDHKMDHLVAVIGYCQIGSARLYAFHSTWDDTIWWANFQLMEKNAYFGIYNGFEFNIVDTSQPQV